VGRRTATVRPQEMMTAPRILKILYSMGTFPCTYSGNPVASGDDPGKAAATKRPKRSKGPFSLRTCSDAVPLAAVTIYAGAPRKALRGLSHKHISLPLIPTLGPIFSCSLPGTW
jgi:hypothetical protein